MPTAIRSTIACPKRSTRRPTTASAGAGRWPRPSSSPPAARMKSVGSSPISCSSQFGVQTMAYYGRFFCGQDEDDDTKKNESGTYALHTLSDDETIARLATGIKRFKLPDEFNCIKIYEQIAAEPQTGYGEQAREQLAQIFENRRQYPKAADDWRTAIEEYGPGDNNYRQQRLDQIVGNWGRFEPSACQPAGQGATVDFRFRNGNKVSFEAHEIKVPKLLDDVKAYLKSRPKQLDWQKINIGDIGYRLVQENQQQYLGDKVAGWDLELKPRPDHVDRPRHRHHAAAEGGRLPAHGEDGRRQHQPHHRLGRRHGHRQEAARQGHVLLRRRRRHRRAGRQGQRRVLRLAAGAGPQHQSVQGRDRQLRRGHRRRRPGDRPAEARRKPISVAHHGHRRQAGRFAYLGFTSVWYAAILRRRVQRRPRSSRSPIGPSIGPSRRCSSSSGSATPSTISRTRPTSPARPSPSRSTIRRARRSSRRTSRPTSTAASTASFRSRPTRRSASIN